MTDEKKLTGYPSIDKPWLKYYNEEAISEPLPECSIYEYIWENNKDHLDDVALVFCDRDITYRDLFENIEHIAQVLLTNGISKSDIVTVCIPNTPEAVYIFYGLNILGATCNLVDPRAARQ